MRSEGATAPAGALNLKVIRKGDMIPAREYSTPSLPTVEEIKLGDILRYGCPQLDQPEAVQQWKMRNLPNLWRGLRRVKVAKALGVPTMFGALWLKVLFASGQEVDLGLVSMRVVTTTGAGYIVDAFQNLTELENMKFHGIGTNSGAEAAGDTALGTELTTEYNPDNTRATGSTTEASATVYRTVGTNTLDGTPGAALREHGVLSQAATGGGVLLDRTMFAAITLSSGDGLQSTYDFTVNTGG